MKELNINEIEQVNGGADWGEVSAGLGAIGLGVAIAVAGPETALVWVAGTELGFWGGFGIGDGLQSKQML